jgi:hypothetical protein
MTAVHHVQVGDAERDPLLYLALGALACLARLDAILERHAPSPADEDDREDGRPGAAGPLHDGIAAALGVVAVRARILRELEAIAAPAMPSPGTTETRPGWLR